MNILIVTQRFRPLIGGAESVLEQFAVECVRQGHAVTVLAAQYQPDWPKTEAISGVRLVRLPLPPTRWLGTARYMAALRSWLRRSGHEFAVCYVSMLKHAAAVAVGARNRCGFPVILRPEGAGPTGDIHWQRRALGRSVIAARCRNADAIVALSPAIRSELEAAGYASGRIREIANGVAIPPIATPQERLSVRHKLGIAPNEAIVLFLGRLSPEKGIAELVSAWAQVELVEPNARLMVLGGGPEESRVRQSSRSCDRITWVGPSTDAQSHLIAADLFVLPSHEEGMSVALLEAMAHARPIVATDISGNRRVLTADEHAVLVAPGIAPVLAEAIVELLRDRVRANRLGSAARRRVESEFSVERMVADHLRLFQQLIDR